MLLTTTIGLGIQQMDGRSEWRGATTGPLAHLSWMRPTCAHVCLLSRSRQITDLGSNVRYSVWCGCSPGPGPIPSDGLLMRGLRYSPRQRRCRLLGIWGERDLRAPPPTGWGGESDTALWCCTRLGRRPLRRFREEEGCCFCGEERCCRRRLEANHFRAWTDAPNKRRSDSLAVRTDSGEGRWFRWFSPGGEIESLGIVPTQRDGGGEVFFFFRRSEAD